MGKFYGSLDNRFAENRNFNHDKLVHEGDDITMYYWSDRTCYFVTRVIDQKRIFVRKYEVCADLSKKGGMGHQDWLYFKSKKELNAYFNKCIDEKLLKRSQEEKVDLNTIVESSEEEWVFRYNKWMQAFNYDKYAWELCLEGVKGDVNPDVSESRIYEIARYRFGLTDKEFQSVMDGKEVVKYKNLRGNVSFGIRDYYYDWEF